MYIPQEENWPSFKRKLTKSVNREARKRGKDIPIYLYSDKPLEEQFYDYAAKYLKAGCKINEIMLDRGGNREKDYYVFPILFNFRHSLELIIKASIFKCEQRADKRMEVIKHLGAHDLSRLFHALLDLHKDQDCITATDLEWLDSFFSELKNIDEESDAFRYPFKLEENKSEAFFDEPKTTITYTLVGFFDEDKHINMVLLQKKITEIYHILEKLYLGSNSTENLLSGKYNAILFEGGGKYKDKSIIYHKNWFKDCDFTPFVDGYMESADLLLNYSLENDEVGIYFLSASYMYRNSIELVLKQIYFDECDYTFHEKAKVLYTSKHSLTAYWKQIRRQLITIDSEFDETLNNQVEDYITQIQNDNGKSDKYRYPIDKSMKMHFKNNERNLGIHNTMNFYKDIYSYLDSLSGLFIRRNEWIAEMRADIDYEDY